MARVSHEARKTTFRNVADIMVTRIEERGTMLLVYTPMILTNEKRLIETIQLSVQRLLGWLTKNSLPEKLSKTGEEGKVLTSASTFRLHRNASNKEGNSF